MNIYLLTLYGFTIYSVFKLIVNKNSLNDSLKYIIVTFVFGYRTVELFKGFKIHPIEVIIFFSIFNILIYNHRQVTKYPRFLKVLLPFCIFSFVFELLFGPGNYVYSTIYGSLESFKHFSNLFLVFFVLSYIKIDFEYLRSLFIVLMAALSFICIGGYIEWFNTSLAVAIFGYSFDIETRNNLDAMFKVFQEDSFNRLNFSWWGSHTAANVALPVLPVGIYLIKYFKKWKIKLLLIFIILFDLYIVYLSGNRFAWLFIVIFLIFYYFFYFRSFSIFIKILPLVVITIFVMNYDIASSATFKRFFSIFQIITGNIDIGFDSSGGSRLKRLSDALNFIPSNPLGMGWGKSGWVHSDFIQFTADLGWVPGMIFMIAPFILTNKLRILLKNEPANLFDLHFTMFILMIYVILTLAVNQTYALAQTGVPTFLCWGLVYAYLNFKSKSQHIH